MTQAELLAWFYNHVWFCAWQAWGVAVVDDGYVPPVLRSSP